jgi:hypothetical protein
MIDMVRYVIQRYARYPIYEPAEGGYCYDGREPDEYTVHDTLIDAINAMRELVRTENAGLSHEDEGLLMYWEDEKSAGAYSVNHKYIGDGYEYFVEPINRRGRARKGKVPYQ